MMEATGSCAGIELFRYLTGRKPGGRRRRC
jgi:hypothetical protein